MDLGQGQGDLPVGAAGQMWTRSYCGPLIRLTLIGILLLGGASATEAFPEDGSAGPRGADPLAGFFPVSFDSEWIRLHIVGDSLEVRGTYILLCDYPTAGPVPLYYPFPRDSMLGGARMVSLSVWVAPGDADRGAAPASWDVLPGARGVRFWMPPCTGDTLVAEAVYRQKILGEYARYIVTTTRYWDLWLP